MSRFKFTLHFATINTRTDYPTLGFPTYLHYTLLLLIHTLDGKKYREIEYLHYTLLLLIPFFLLHIS